MLQCKALYFPNVSCNNEIIYVASDVANDNNHYDIQDIKK